MLALELGTAFLRIHNVLFMILKMTYTIIRSDRKTVALQIKNGELTVRVPQRTKDSEIAAFVDAHRAWIEKHLASAVKKESEAENEPPISQEELSELKEMAMRVIPPKVEHFAARIGVRYGRITVRHQKTRWGSCTSMGNLSFNCLLMLAPESVLDSVVVHELCHLKEMNHSARFYKEVYRVCPDYDAHRAWLKKNGEKLISRMKKL